MKEKQNKTISFLHGSFAGRFPFSTKTIELSQGRMAYIDEGQGESLLFLHGNPTWSFIYREFIQTFLGGFRTIAPDHLGFGRSEKPVAAAYTLDWHIDNLTELIDQLKLEDLTLILHDWGGPIGLGYAIKNPKKIKRLILFNTWAFVSQTEIQLPALLQAIKKEGIGEKLVLEQNVMIEKAIPESIANWKSLDSSILSAYRAPFQNPPDRQAILKLVREIPAHKEDGAAATLKTIQANLRHLRIPCLIIWGEQDPIFPPELVTMWRLYFPQARCHFLKNASHFLQEDCPQEIIHHMITFLEENP